MPYTKLLYQIVYSTKHREPAMHKDGRPALFRRMWGLLQNKHCHLYRLNGVEDHLHIITHIHPTIALADLVKDLKLSSWNGIKSDGIFADFPGWQDGYAAFTYSIDALNSLIEYVKNQEAHHRGEDFVTELKRMLDMHGISYDERFLL